MKRGGWAGSGSGAPEAWVSGQAIQLRVDGGTGVAVGLARLHPEEIGRVGLDKGDVEERDIRVDELEREVLDDERVLPL